MPDNLSVQMICLSSSVKTMAVFTLEDEQIVWMDKSSQINKSSDVQTGQTNFSMNKSSDICLSGDQQVDDSTT